MADIEDRRPSLEETLARSAELMAESERLLAPPEEPAATGPTTYDWRPASHYRAADDMLKGLETKINRRMAEFEWQLKADRERSLELLDVLADEAGGAAGRTRENFARRKYSTSQRAGKPSR